MACVGERIKKRREELEWAQNQLAQKAGISKSFLSDLENGKRSVGAETLLDIARVLGMSLDFLMTCEASRDEAAEVPIPASLAKFAAEGALSFRHTITLLGMQQILARHRARKKAMQASVDWRKFHDAVKEFLEDK